MNGGHNGIGCRDRVHKGPFRERANSTATAPREEESSIQLKVRTSEGGSSAGPARMDEARRKP